MKTVVIAWSLLIGCGLTVAQPGVEYYPHHPGDVWQFRTFSTGEVSVTHYIDSVRVDTVSREHLIFKRFRAGNDNLSPERLDSLGNVYTVNFRPMYPLYRLYADSGESWFRSYDPYDSNLTYHVTVTGIYPAFVFGVPTTVKVFRFQLWVVIFGDTVRLTQSVHHLASGFGLVRDDVEPSESHYLAGAIINGIRYGTIVGLKENRSTRSDFSLRQNYPNPFNPSTEIRYELPEPARVSLTIYDVLGRKAETLLDEAKGAGCHTVQWNAAGRSTGVYLARFTATTAAGSTALLQTMKLVLTK
jgi:hypothetical protein